MLLEFGQAHGEILVHINSASSDGSDETARMHSLARALASRMLKVGTQRKCQTKIRPGRPGYDKKGI